MIIRLFTILLTGTLVLNTLADYSMVAAPFFSDAATAGGAEVLIPDANGHASTGAFKIGRVMDAKIFGQMNAADEKFVRCAAVATLAVDGERLRITFDCPIPAGVALSAPNSPWWGDRVSFSVHRTADDGAIYWFVAGAGGASETGRFPLSGGKDTSWKSTTRFTVTTNAAAYHVVMDIPLADAFGKLPEPGDVFGVNFKRLGQTAGGPSSWAVNGGAFNSENEVFGALVIGGSNQYFCRRLAAAEQRASAIASDDASRATVERLLRPLRQAIAEHGSDPQAFDGLDRMFSQLDRSLVAVTQHGDTLMLFEPENAWGNDLAPTIASRPLERITIRTARNTRAVRAFALSNLSGAGFVGCLKAFDRDWWYFQFQNSDGHARKNGLTRHIHIRRGVPIYSRSRRTLYDPLIDLPVGSLVELAADSTVPLFLELDTHGLAPGTYNGYLKLQSCAPGFADRQLPLEVTVTDDDLDTVDNWRTAYTHFARSCNPGYEPLTNAVRELVRRGYNTILLSRLDFYPRRDANGVWHDGPFTITDRYIDLWLAAGLDPKKMRLQPYLAVEREYDAFEGIRDHRRVRIPFGTPEYDEGFKFMVRSLTDHFQKRYGVGIDRIVWYPVDEALGKFPDSTLKSAASRDVYAARLIKDVDRANIVFSDPMWNFLESRDFLAAKDEFAENIDIIAPSRPQLSDKVLNALKTLKGKELMCYHVSERENPPDNYRLHTWQNLRDGMRPTVTYWHNDEGSGFSFKNEHAYASTYVDQDLDIITISRRQLAADMAHEEGRLVDYLKSEYRDNPAKLSKIDELVRSGADGRSMKAMDRALEGLCEMLQPAK